MFKWGFWTYGFAKAAHLAMEDVLPGTDGMQALVSKLKVNAVAVLSTVGDD